jgi:hypothetical protein
MNLADPLLFDAPLIGGLDKLSGYQQASLDGWVDMAAACMRGFKEAGYEYSHMKLQVEKHMDPSQRSDVNNVHVKTYIYQKNTFMHVKEVIDEEGVMPVLRRCNSEPAFPSDSDDTDYRNIASSSLTSNSGPGRLPVSDSDSASSRPTDQPNDSLSDCSYQTDDEFDSSLRDSRSGAIGAGSASDTGGERSDSTSIQGAASNASTHGPDISDVSTTKEVNYSKVPNCKLVHENQDKVEERTAPGSITQGSKKEIKLRNARAKWANMTVDDSPCMEWHQSPDVEEGSPLDQTFLTFKVTEQNAGTAAQGSNGTTTDSGKGVHKHFNDPLQQCNSGQQRQELQRNADIKADTSPQSLIADNESPESPDSGDPDSPSQTGVLKSVGSAGHPTHCCECQFFFFSLTGCKKGSDCRYCHEFHPRAKEKKNRKLRRRLDEVGKKQEKLGIENANSFNGNSVGHEQSQSNLHPNAAGIPLPEHQADRPKVETSPGNVVTSTAPENYLQIAPEYGVADQTSNIGASMGKFTLMYLPCSGKREFVFLVGQRVDLQPLLHRSDIGECPKKDVLTYSVSPPLPAGLELDVKTGIISGIVTEPSAYRGITEHAIKVGVRVLAAWNNMVLGSLTLCEVRIRVRIVSMADLQNQIRWIQECPGGSLKIEFHDVEYSDDGVAVYQ